MNKPHIVIISPATAKANNGNWRTAQRWGRFLQSSYSITLSLGEIPSSADAMIALHARRSAPAIAAFSIAHPTRPLILVLTGTDLYRDIHTDPAAQRSLDLASHLVVLQSAGMHVLPAALRHKACIIYQSSNALKPINHLTGKKRFMVSMIGHLREEKDPLTFMKASELTQSSRLHFIHIGSAMDPALEQAACARQDRNAKYRWLGGQPHARTRQLLKQSQLMVITSKMEGGANVIAEALTSGVPVLASDISGNRGMLGDDYAGYFTAGDFKQLAALIDRAAVDQVFYQVLCRQCDKRAPLFSPEREKAALLQLLDNAIITERIDS